MYELNLVTICLHDLHCFAFERKHLPTVVITVALRVVWRKDINARASHTSDKATARRGRRLMTLWETGTQACVKLLMA